MAQHLASGAQFLGFTLHQALKGVPTRLLVGFDAQATAATTAADFASLPRAALLESLEQMDARVDVELDALEAVGWAATAEAPPGQVPAHVAVNHFLFDSWVHERDLLLPLEQEPDAVAHEAAVVVSYALALAGVVRAVGDDARRQDSIRVHLTDLDLDLDVDVADDGARVIFAAPGRRPNVVSTAGAVVDVMTGRRSRAAPTTDAPGSAFLGRLAAVMA